MKEKFSPNVGGLCAGGNRELSMLHHCMQLNSQFPYSQNTLSFAVTLPHSQFIIRILPLYSQWRFEYQCYESLGFHFGFSCHSISSDYNIFKFQLKFQT